MIASIMLESDIIAGKIISHWKYKISTLYKQMQQLFSVLQNTYVTNTFHSSDKLQQTELQ